MYLGFLNPNLILVCPYSKYLLGELYITKIISLFTENFNIIEEMGTGCCLPLTLVLACRGFITNQNSIFG